MPEIIEESFKAQKLRIVCVGAHPGDPEFGCGGTMALYKNAGHQLTFLYLNRGEAYDSSQSHEKSAAIRSREAETACKIVGATAAFAGQVDGESKFSLAWQEKFNEQLAAFTPDIVFSQWPIDSHPDHQVTGQLTLNAWLHAGRSFKLYFYEVNTGSETMAFNPVDYVDISGVMETKQKLMFAHQSQWKLSGDWKPV